MKKLYFLLLCIIVLQMQFSTAGELEADDHTLLLFHFNNSLVSVDGESPTIAKGVTFEQGMFDNGLRLHRGDAGDSLYYSVPEFFNPAEGSVEFWLKPCWEGTEFYVMQVFNLGDIRVQINVPGIIAFFMLSPENEIGYHNVEGWTNNEWHHIAATWKIPGRQKFYVDGAQIMDNPATEVDLLQTIPEILRIGGVFASENVDAIIDEFRLSNIERTPQEIAQTVMAGEFNVTSIELDVNSIRLLQAADFSPKINAVTDIGVSFLPNAVATWTIADTTIATVDDLGKIVAKSSGQTGMTATYGSFTLDATITVDEILLPPESVPVDSFLAAPAENALREIPVVIVSYLPLLDQTCIEWSIPGEQVALEEVKTRIKMFSRRVKFAVEEGSRYHGYKDSTAIPSLGYRVVDMINIYEHMPISKDQCWWNPKNCYPDYHKVFEKINGQHYVNDLDVKEFWIWYTGFEFNGIGFELPESNLFSPVTGDISNSARLANDLPVCDQSYIVYQFDWTGNHAYAIHNIGHQIESMLGYANEKQDGDNHLFFHKFCGMDSTETWITGRCGWTHMPPNVNSDYLYEDTTHVLSDCEDWTPDNSGEKKWVNDETWGNIPYQWPDEPDWTPGDSPYHISWQKTESQFYIYWRQNIPGYQNNITFDENKYITNWWTFLGDWDTAISNNTGLYVDSSRVTICNNDPDKLLKQFVLYPNFPNPFNSSTFVRYQLAGQSHVTINIYNALGQHMRTLVDGAKQSGTFVCKWDGKNVSGIQVASGIYFVTIKAKSSDKTFQKTNKMLFLQ